MRSAGCNIFSVITSRLESSVVIRASRSLGNDAFDIYSCSTSVPDALVVCSLFYWAWWVSLSLLLSSMADSVTTAIYPPDSTRSTIDQMVDVARRRHKRTAQSRILDFSFQMTISNRGSEQVEAWWRKLVSTGDTFQQLMVADSSPEDVSFSLTWQPWTSAVSHLAFSFSHHPKKHLCKDQKGLKLKKGMTFFYFRPKQIQRAKWLPLDLTSFSQNCRRNIPTLIEKADSEL